MSKKPPKPKKTEFTVGLWLNLKDKAHMSTMCHLWHIEKGKHKFDDLQWYTTVKAYNEMEAIELAKTKYQKAKKRNAA